jgi:hypothetical protein
MRKATCKHCEKEIGEWTDPWGGHRAWMHAPDDGPDAYQFCHCQCDGCRLDTTLSWNAPCPADCCDGEEAEPAEIIAGPQPVVAIMDAEPEANL